MDKVSKSLLAFIVTLVAAILLVTLVTAAPPSDAFTSFMESAQAAKEKGWIGMARFTARHAGERVDWTVMILDKKSVDTISILIVGTNKDAKPDERAEIHFKGPLSECLKDGDKVRVLGRFAALTAPTGVLVTGEKVTKSDKCPCN